MPATFTAATGEPIRAAALAEMGAALGKLSDALAGMGENAEKAIAQRAALVRSLHRANALLVERCSQRTQLAVRVEGLTGTPWEQVLADIGLDMATGRDPQPSAGTPEESDGDLV